VALNKKKKKNDDERFNRTCGVIPTIKEAVGGIENNV